MPSQLHLSQFRFPGAAAAVHLFTFLSLKSNSPHEDFPFVLPHETNQYLPFLSSAFFYTFLNIGYAIDTSFQVQKELKKI